MFSVTDAAKNQVAEFFKEREQQPIRVFLHEGGCSGPTLAMALDKERDGDSKFEVGGVEYLVNEQFLETAKPIEVDYKSVGFTVSSGLALESGCSSCGSKKGCGG
ncbi:MAG: IscA/HesB family protein [Desulfococcaceae bacterium]